MIDVIVFIVLSIPVVILSWRTLFSFRNHGLYRFVAWECILWLAVKNYSYWFTEPFSLSQILSWAFLFYALYLAVAGAILLRHIGKADTERKDGTLYAFEKTTQLVETGLYRYIRHPLYASLVFLAWGVLFKHTDYVLIIIAAVASVFLFITMKIEEKENIRYFGESYRDYISRTKMFIPFLV